MKNSWTKYLMIEHTYPGMYVPEEFLISPTKLRNAVLKNNPTANYEFFLKWDNESPKRLWRCEGIPELRRGCRGYIINKDNGLKTYVCTSPSWQEEPRGFEKLVRFQFWSPYFIQRALFSNDNGERYYFDTLKELAEGINKHLKGELK